MANSKKDSADIEASDFSDDIVSLAKQSLVKYLHGKILINGDVINEPDLVTLRNLKIVMETPFDDLTFDYIHEWFLLEIPKPDPEPENSVAWSVRYLISLLREMNAMALPKKFQPGLLILYFHYCQNEPLYIHPNLTAGTSDLIN